ncbi:50S ribosomal protein L18 [Litorivicinus sp.]|jgi:large subunit ribosomal protein L18|nr:50S ribosomal protein L18 [Litorivicinus sp.]MDC1208379.1 50S ribosomal protein L18 [Litorivicinus sp.]MDC1240644.1 50S ribosomal protein L18 [Litorivicinus sp.]MDC1467084.1 50S ribosomal protein L18 [Litorivicinus sp.]
MMDKKQSRLRRARRGRAKMRELDVNRLCVHRTPRHIYAQIISGNGASVICAASTLDKGLREMNGGNANAAIEVGKLIAERAKEKGISTVAFDRSGFRYHGRVKALADAARENGLEF